MIVTTGGRVTGPAGFLARLGGDDGDFRRGRCGCRDAAVSALGLPLDGMMVTATL